MKILELYLQNNHIDKEYIKLALKLRKMINKTVRKMPKSYRYIITNNILILVQEITNNCLKSEYIKLDINLSIEQFKEKQNLLIKANQNLFILRVEIVFLFEMLNEGNNIFQSAEESDKIFDKLMNTMIKLSKLIDNIYQLNINNIKKIKSKNI